MCIHAFRGSPIKELIAAIGHHRRVEPRLSGGFVYTPCQRKLTGYCFNSLRPLPIASLARALRGLRHRPETAAVLHAIALGEVLADDGHNSLPKGVDDLRRAVSEAPEDTEILNDLGASELLLAQKISSPYHLVLALNDLETVLSRHPKHPLALFNRALALEHLSLQRPALTAWQEVLTENPGMGWDEEAIAHISTLSSPPSRLLWRLRLPALELAAKIRDTAELSRIIAPFPQEAREYSTEELLAAWGRLTLTHHDREAADRLAAASEIGSVLYKDFGEATVRDAVGSIRQALTRKAKLDLAHSYAFYALGMSCFRASDTTASKRYLIAAEAPLRHYQSPLAQWTSITLAAVAEYEHHPSQAIELLEPVLRSTAAYPAIKGRAEWYRGLVEAKEGRPGSALWHYQKAIVAFTDLGERENLGAVQGLIAEALGILGDHEGAWNWRLRALSTLSAYPKSLRLHNLLRESADAALKAGQLKAAIIFQNEGVKVAVRSGRPEEIAEALLWRSRILSALSQVHEASSDLEHAQREISRCSVGPTRAKLETDRWLAVAEYESQAGHTSAALKVLDDVVLRYRSGNSALDLAIALLLRAEKEADLGLDMQAENDQAAAISLFEQQRISINDQHLLATAADEAGAAFDRMVRMQAERRHRPDKALEFFERSRLLDPRRTVVRGLLKPLHEQLAAIPNGVTILELAIVEDNLYEWVLTRDNLRFKAHKLDSQQLEREIAALISSLTSPRRDFARAQAIRLYQQLIPLEVASLQPGSPFVIVPDKVLNALPFATLVHPKTGRYLMADHPLTLVPSLYYATDRWLRPKRESSSWRVTVVANPAFDPARFPGFTYLPAADNEAAAISSLYPGTRLIQGRDATLSNILNGLANSEIFHFAGHSVIDENQPGRSYLLIAPEPASLSGLLLASDFRGKHFPNLRLVVLSSCRTTTTQKSRAVGIEGLIVPLIESGASTVVASLWNVDDLPSSQFFKEFHSSFRRTRDAAQALRTAQLSMLNGAIPSFRSPATWAAFQAYGFLRPDPL